MRDRFNLDGKVAIVTGASKDMGAAVAETLAEFGADVAVTARDLGGLEASAAAIRAHGRRALVVPANLLEMAEIPGIVERTVEGLGGVDILVNVAGSGPWSTYDWAMRLSEQQWDDMFMLNVKAPFFLCQAAARAMRQRGGGSIVNISSGAGSHAAPRMGNYGAAKAALDNISTTMASEWGRFKIRVNVVISGLVDTKNARDSTFVVPDREELFRASMPLGRIGLPSDIASAVLYLASPASEFVNGTTLLVNGAQRPVRVFD